MNSSASARAFSLVEVCLAIGVLSFSLLTVIGLLPVGLTTMRRAMDAATERNIVRQLGAEASGMPYSRLRSDYAATQVRYFDDQGLALSNSANAYYRASVSFGQTEFPGSDNVPLTNALQMIQIRIATDRSATTNFYNILVASSGN